MASTRIKPFPLSGLVPYRGALYSITHQEVFSQGRLYRIGRYEGDRYDERVLINHWELLESIERLARFKVGDRAWHATLGEAVVVKRAWRFAAGAVVCQVRTAGADAWETVWERDLKPLCR